jgi:hypothetical protein
LRRVFVGIGAAYRHSGSLLRSGRIRDRTIVFSSGHSRIPWPLCQDPRSGGKEEGVLYPFVNVLLKKGEVSQEILSSADNRMEGQILREWKSTGVGGRIFRAERRQLQNRGTRLHCIHLCAATRPRAH